MRKGSAFLGGRSFSCAYDDFVTMRQICRAHAVQTLREWDQSGAASKPMVTA